MEYAHYYFGLMLLVAFLGGYLIGSIEQRFRRNWWKAGLVVWLVAFGYCIYFLITL